MVQHGPCKRKRNIERTGKRTNGSLVDLLVHGDDVVNGLVLVGLLLNDRLDVLVNLEKG